MPKDTDPRRLIDTAINTALSELPAGTCFMDIVGTVWELVGLEVAKANEAYIEAQVEVMQ